MPVCGLISKSITLQCPPDSPVSGTIEDFWLINYSERGAYNFNATTGLVDAFALTVGSNTRKIEGANNTTVPSSTWENTGLYGNHVHRVDFILPSLDALDLDQYNKLALGTFIAIVEKKYPTNNKFFILGLSSGLKMVEGSWEFNNQDRTGLPFVGLATREPDLESSAPVELLLTDTATTRSTLVGLETVAQT